MKKYLLLYLVFWLPALLAAYLPDNGSLVIFLIQLACATTMVVGWCGATRSLARHSPRDAMLVLSLYAIFNIITITVKYHTLFGTALYHFMRNWGGLISYKPMQVFVRLLWDFDIPQEAWVMTGVVALCGLGWLLGLLDRRQRGGNRVA